MSLCSCTVRALSRSRISTSRTLLPFLYQTATIQQWRPATRSIARRNLSSRPNPVDDIPFEDVDGNLPPNIDEAQSARKTTITDTERAAFEKLYKTFNTKGQGRSKGKDGEHEELDQIADEYYEDDEEGSSNSLDKVFDAVLKGSPRSQDARRDGRRIPPNKTGESARPGKDGIATETSTPKSKLKLAKAAEKERIKKLRLEERERVDRLLKSAQTDQQLWKTLDSEVFDQLRKLDLDAPKSAKKDKSKAQNPGTLDTRILFPNYPHHLLTAVQTLRTHFPTSPLPLTILSTIRSLGRSSYALGATTQLYRLLLRTAWLQQSSYTLIDTLLTDMETNIVEFDHSILEVIEAVIREHDMARSGRLGREMQMVYGMEMWIEGTRKMRSWKKVVAEKLGVSVRPVERVDRPVVRQVRRSVGGRDVGEGRSRGMSDAIPFVGTEQTEAAAVTQDGVADSVPSEMDDGAVGEQPDEAEKPEHDADEPSKILL